MSEPRVTSGSVTGNTSAGDGLAADKRPMLVAVVVLALAFALVPRALRGVRSATSEVAPEFSGTFIANAPIGDDGVAKPAMKLSDFHGRPVLLDFWATWCGPCQAEMPIVNGIAERFRDQGLVVVGVNTSDDGALAKAFVARRNVRIPIIHDDGNAIAHKFQVENLPTLILVSKDGKIEAIRHGVTSDADLERMVKHAL